MQCIACGGLLYFVPDSYPLAFHCIRNHFFSLRDLLDELAPQGKTPPASTLKGWEERALQLHQMAAQALRGGHAFHAADFQEAANQIDQWTSKLRALLPGG